jgi:hypothetical protein
MKIKAKIKTELWSDGELVDAGERTVWGSNEGENFILEVGIMKKQFVECKDRRTAKRRCPWAARIVKVEGGFMAFESVADYYTWKNQT